MKTSQKFPKSLVGDFTFDLQSEQHRNRLFLPRNMKRVLVHHATQRAKEQTNGANKRPPLTNGCRESSFLNTGQRNGSQLRASITKPGYGTAPTSGASNGNLSNVVGPYDENDQPSDSVTSKPWLEQVSKSCLAVTDSSSRRSRRNQIDPFQDKGAVLTLKPRNIRKKLNFNSKKSQRDGSDDERPRKRMRRDAIECLCHVTVWDNREGISATEALVKRSQTCYLRTSDDGVAGSVVVDMDISAPIVIKASELEVLVKQKEKESPGIADKYFLEIKIIPCRSETHWPPVPVLSKSEGELFAGRGNLTLEALQGALVARYMHLPHAPASEIPLSVFFVQGGRAYKTKYGLEIGGEWGKPVPVIMPKKEEPIREPSNFAPWALDEGGAPFGRRLSSDSGKTRKSSRRSLRKLDSTVEVSYVFDPRSKETSKESRKATLKGFCCPACRIGQFEALSELQFHLINSHHKYKFDLEAEEHDPATGELKAVTFHVNSAEVRKPRERDIKSEWEWNWEAPKRPFDVDAFVKGDHSWIGAQTKKPRAVAALVLSSDPVMAHRQKNGGFLPVDLVPELPEPKRKKYPVVELNTKIHIPSYSSITHNELRLSQEPLSDTDNEIDGTFVKQKHRKTIEDENGVGSARTKFRQPWDQWRMDEGDVTGDGGASSRFFSDSLARFVRRDAAAGVLAEKEPEVLTEFAKFLQVPKEMRELDGRIVRDVMQVISERQRDSRLEKTVNSEHHERGDVDMPDVGQDGKDLTNAADLALEERMQKLLTLPAGSCGICERKIVRITRDMVQCADVGCETPDVMYHLGCAQTQDLEWTCSLCVQRAESRAREKGKGRAWQSVDGSGDDERWHTPTRFMAPNAIAERSQSERSGSAKSGLGSEGEAS